MDSEYILGPDGELYHWGIKGMRWGQRRYQNKDGSLTPAGKKRYDKEMAKIKAETKKLKNQERTDKKISKLEEAKKNLADLKTKKKTAVEEKKTDDAAEENDAIRQRIFTKPTAKDVIENRHLFNDKEVQALRLRLQEEQAIKNMIPAEVDKGKEFVNKASEKFSQVTQLVNTGSVAWNSIARVYNSFYGNKHDAALPLISDKITSKLDKLKEDAETKEYQNRIDRATKEIKDRHATKEKSELELLKESAEAEETLNRLEKARAERDKRNNPTASDPTVEETRKNNLEYARLNSENKLRDARARKAELDAEDATRKAKADEEAEQARLKRLKDNAESKPYSIKGGEKTTIKPGALAITNTPGNSKKSEYGSKSYQKKVDKILQDMDNAAWDTYNRESKNSGNSSSSNALTPATLSKIHTLTSSSNKTYSEIAKQLGVSLSTVQNYSRGRDTAFSLLDENGNAIFDYD